MTSLHGFIQALPKAELHCHIEGTLEPELMMKLSEKNKIKIPYSTVEEIRAAYQFNNLQSFLDLYYLGANVLQTEEDFYDLTYAYLTRSKQDNVRHTEIFFDPQTHTDRGIAFETVIKGIYKALEDGHKKLGISFKLIMCFLRHLSEKEAFKTLELARPFHELIDGIGLDSSEVGHPPQKFQNVFTEAQKQGYWAVAHAGEEGPANYIWDALKLLHAKRIDHGVRCVEDPELVAYLRTNRIPLTVCPLSNVKLKVFPSMQAHNIHKLLKEQLVVTINSDDPAYFDGYINDNYIAVADAFHLNAKELSLIAKNSFMASFLRDQEKKKAIDEIDFLVQKLAKAG